MSGKEETWFLTIKLPSGEQWRYNVRAVQEMLGISELQRRVASLEGRTEELEAPVRRAKILELLQESEKPRTRRWIRARVPRFQGIDLVYLLADGKVVRIEPEGRGHVKYEPAERWLTRGVHE